MVGLDRPLDYVWMLLIAAGLGAVGGIAFELLQTRRGDVTGALELPGRRPDRRFFDFGFLSSMLLGATAAVAAAYFFTPEVQVKVDLDGAEEIKTRWQITRLVPLSLIVGSAGGAFLAAAQARILAKLSEQKVRTTEAVANAVTERVAEEGRSAGVQAANAVAAKLQPAVAQAVHRASAELPPDLVTFVKEVAGVQPKLVELVERRESAKPEEHLSTVQAAIEQATAAAIGDLDVRLAEQVKTAQRAIAAAAADRE